VQNQINSITCLFVETADGWSCPVCDPDMKHLLRRPAVRSCSRAPENLAARRKLLETSLAEFHARNVEAGVIVRPLAEALETIEHYCKGCDQFTGDNCRQLMGCAQREKWMRAYGLSSGYLPRLVNLAKPCERMIDGR